MLVFNYSSLFMAFSFAGGFNLPRGCPGLFSQGGGWMGQGAARGAQCVLVSSAVSGKQLWSQLLGKNGFIRFSIGRFSMGKGSKMLPGLILIYALSSACFGRRMKRKKKKKKKR
jgi:hypothetical protein